MACEKKEEKEKPATVLKPEVKPAVRPAIAKKDSLSIGAEDFDLDEE